MTENGDPSGAPGDENAITERVNDILKAEFRLNRVFKSQPEPVVATEMAVHDYNTLRPHMSGPPRLRLLYATSCKYT